MRTKKNIRKKDVKNYQVLTGKSMAVGKTIFNKRELNFIKKGGSLENLVRGENLRKS